MIKSPQRTHADKTLNILKFSMYFSFEKELSFLKNVYSQNIWNSSFGENPNNIPEFSSMSYVFMINFSPSLDVFFRNIINLYLYVLNNYLK